MPSPLEAQLTALTREFVSNIVAILKTASFADVASFSWDQAAAVPARRRNAVTTKPPTTPARRQTSERRAELSSRVVQALSKAGEPMGVRALSSELDVPPDRLAVPLKDLRAAGRVAKHGDKRATTYSLA